MKGCRATNFLRQKSWCSWKVPHLPCFETCILDHFTRLKFDTVVSGQKNTSKSKFLPQLCKEQTTLWPDDPHKAHSLQSNVAPTSFTCPQWSFIRWIWAETLKQLIFGHSQTTEAHQGHVRAVLVPSACAQDILCGMW